MGRRSRSKRPRRMVYTDLPHVRVEAVEEAVVILHITLPVRIIYEAIPLSEAAYAGVINGEHLVKLCKHVEGSNASLWHELIHARQCERDYACNTEAMVAEYFADLERTGGINALEKLCPTQEDYDAYRANPLEAEAHEWSERLAPTLCLVDPPPPATLADYISTSIIAQFEEKVYEAFLYGDHEYKLYGSSSSRLDSNGLSV